MMRFETIPQWAACWTLSAVASCGPHDDCKPKSTRCAESVAQVCDADRNYQDVANCDDVSEQNGPAFVCRYVDERVAGERIKGHACVPAESDK